jgi:hypothetical protein
VEPGGRDAHPAGRGADNVHPTNVFTSSMTVAWNPLTSDNGFDLEASLDNSFGTVISSITLRRTPPASASTWASSSANTTYLDPRGIVVERHDQLRLQYPWRRRH